MVSTDSISKNLSKLKGPDLIAQLNYEMQNGYKTLMIFLAIAVILFILLAFCIFNIVKIVQFYWSQKRAMADTVKRGTNNPQNRKDDDETYMNRVEAALEAENNDEYLLYTEAINKSISEFKTYNEKLKAYYKENKPGEAAKDMIDNTIFADNADNY